jgi:hypothetical protein
MLGFKNQLLPRTGGVVNLCYQSIISPRLALKGWYHPYRFPEFLHSCLLVTFQHWFECKPKEKNILSPWNFVQAYVPFVVCSASDPTHLCFLNGSKWSLLACISHQIYVIVTNFYYPEIYSFFWGTNTLRNFFSLPLDASCIRRVLSPLNFLYTGTHNLSNYFSAIQFINPLLL